MPREVVHDFFVLWLFVIGSGVADEGSYRLFPKAASWMEGETLPFRPAVDWEDCVAGKGQDRGHSAAVVSPTGVFSSGCFSTRSVGIPQEVPLPVDAQEEVEYTLHVCEMPLSHPSQVKVDSLCYYLFSFM